MSSAASVQSGRRTLGWGQDGPNGLSQRELEVIDLLARGFTNKQIARELSINLVTVKHHFTHIFRKTGVTSRLELALLIFDHSLLSTLHN